VAWLLPSTQLPVAVGYHPVSLHIKDCFLKSLFYARLYYGTLSHTGLAGRWTVISLPFVSYVRGRCLERSICLGTYLHKHLLKYL
jgi:hypothetical protein